MQQLVDHKNNCSPFPELQEVNESQYENQNKSSGYNLSISHVSTENKPFSGEISSMMQTVSEDKSTIDLKNNLGRKTRNHMAELNQMKRHQQNHHPQQQQVPKSNLSAIEELNMRYVKQFSEQFVWYAAVGYDMVPESVAVNWKILPEKIVPAVIQGWQIKITQEKNLVLEPLIEETINSENNMRSDQHFLTLLYWMPVSNINKIFRNKYQHFHPGTKDPELLHISEYQGFPILGISNIKFMNKESLKIKDNLQRYFTLRGLI